MQEAMQDKYNKQLQIIQQQLNTSTLEKKFDSLMELLLKDSTTIQRESPVPKKGKPTNLEETILSQIKTPPRSNTNNKAHQKNPEQNMQVHEELPIGPQMTQTTWTAILPTLVQVMETGLPKERRKRSPIE
jgi:hypothetical protein